MNLTAHYVALQGHKCTTGVCSGFRKLQRTFLYERQQQQPTEVPLFVQFVYASIDCSSPEASVLLGVISTTPRWVSRRRGHLGWS